MGKHKYASIYVTIKNLGVIWSRLGMGHKPLVLAEGSLKSRSSVAAWAPEDSVSLPVEGAPVLSMNSGF